VNEETEDLLGPGWIVEQIRSWAQPRRGTDSLLAQPRRGVTYQPRASAAAQPPSVALGQIRATRQALKGRNRMTSTANRDCFALSGLPSPRLRNPALALG
jgi:hypothetical protein